MQTFCLKLQDSLKNIYAFFVNLGIISSCVYFSLIFSREEKSILSGQEKKKKFPILMLIPAVVILAAAVIIFVFVLPGRNADKDPEEIGRAHV